MSKILWPVILLIVAVQVRSLKDGAYIERGLSEIWYTAIEDINVNKTSLRCPAAATLLGHQMFYTSLDSCKMLVTSPGPNLTDSRSVYWEYFRDVSTTEDANKQVKFAMTVGLSSPEHPALHASDNNDTTYYMSPLALNPYLFFYNKPPINISSIVVLTCNKTGMNESLFQEIQLKVYRPVGGLVVLNSYNGPDLSLSKISFPIKDDGLPVYYVLLQRFGPPQAKRILCATDVYIYSP